MYLYFLNVYSSCLETTKRPASPKCHQSAEYFEAPTLPVQTFSCPPPNTSQIPIPLYSQSPQKRCCCPPKTKKETPAKKSKCICGPKNKPTSKLSTISKEASVQMMENAINLCKCEMELQALKVRSIFYVKNETLTSENQFNIFVLFALH